MGYSINEEKENLSTRELMPSFRIWISQYTPVINTNHYIFTFKSINNPSTVPTPITFPTLVPFTSMNSLKFGQKFNFVKPAKCCRCYMIAVIVNIFNWISKSVNPLIECNNIHTFRYQHHPSMWAAKYIPYILYICVYITIDSWIYVIHLPI